MEGHAVDNSALFNPNAGKTRDDDGTVDRVKDPPKILLPFLACMKEKCKIENVDLLSVFEEEKASHTGLMATTRFISAMVIAFPRCKFDAPVLQALKDAYGVGFKNPGGQFETIAWMDFCEDVAKAVDPTKDQVATLLARSRSSTISFKALNSDLDDLYLL